MPMSASLLPPSGSAPADPAHPPPPSPEEIADLKRQALEALDCTGQPRSDLAIAIGLIAKEGHTAGLRMIADHGCARGAEAACTFWRKLGEAKIAKVAEHKKDAFFRIAKRHQSAREMREGGNVLQHDLVGRALDALAIHGDVRMDVRPF
jgi:hypothetical protein